MVVRNEEQEYRDTTHVIHTKPNDKQQGLSEQKIEEVTEPLRKESGSASSEGIWNQKLESRDKEAGVPNFSDTRVNSSVRSRVRV